MDTTWHDSDALLSHLTFLKDSGHHSIALGYLLGDDNKSYIAIEPIITSLQGIDKTNLLFKIDENKLLTLSASDKSINISFKLNF